MLRLDFVLAEYIDDRKRVAHRLNARRIQLRELIHIADHPCKVGSRLFALRLINLQTRKLSDIGNEFIVDFHIFILSSLKLGCF